ncbi:MAG: hypothetical protein AAGC55_20630 [Myxococcota bacterium]
MAMIAGCSDSDDTDGTTDPPGENDLLAPPAEGQGYQFAMRGNLAPGVEAEQCKFVLGPADGMYINSDEVKYTAGSHHFLLYETPYTEIPTVSLNGETIDTSDFFDCSDGPSEDWELTRLIGGSQNSVGDSMVEFPEGVAISVRPDAVLLMNAHYINASDQTLEPDVRINLYTIPEDEVTVEGDLLFLYNPFIKVGAMGQSRARMRCPVTQDITILNAQSHMHARGVSYEAAIEGQEPFYSSTNWENVPVADFSADGGIQVPAGSYLDYYCDYANGEMRDVYQGPRSTDEMCMLIGSYYPVDPIISNCGDVEVEVPEAYWVGNGSATCAQTLDCLLAVLTTQTDELQLLQGLTTCMLDSDSAVSGPMSEAVRCILTAEQNPLTECAQQIETCQTR